MADKWNGSWGTSWGNSWGASSGTNGGVRSLAAFWIGGASSASAPAASGGVRSLLAFWMGGASSGDTTPPVVVGKKPGARKLRINHIFLHDDEEEWKELPKPTKKRIKQVEEAVLADAAGLLGYEIPPRIRRTVHERVQEIYRPRVDPYVLRDQLNALLQLTIDRINAEIEQEDEDIIFMMPAF